MLEIGIVTPAPASTNKVKFWTVAYSDETGQVICIPFDDPVVTLIPYEHLILEAIPLGITPPKFIMVLYDVPMNPALVDDGLNVIWPAVTNDTGIVVLDKVSELILVYTSDTLTVFTDPPVMVQL